MTQVKFVFVSKISITSFLFLGWNHRGPSSSRFRRQRHEPTPENQGHETAGPSQHSKELTPFVLKNKIILSSLIVFHMYAWLSYVHL